MILKIVAYTANDTTPASSSTKRGGILAALLAILENTTHSSASERENISEELSKAFDPIREPPHKVMLSTTCKDVRQYHTHKREMVCLH